MTHTPSFDPVPPAPLEWHPMWAAKVQTMMNVLLSKANCAAHLTLEANATSTVMSDPRLSAFSVLTFMPTTATAAIAHGTIYVTGQNNGTATINHATTADLDKTFMVAIHG
jgi:hypothetical protein